jgi:hypothetical protein
MIKLFHNIRQNLLDDPPEHGFSVPARQSHSGGRAGGKTSRYLKYAIGEIKLVVIEKNNLNLKAHAYRSPPGRGQGWVSTR